MSKKIIAPILLDAVLGTKKVRNHIYRIGIELEGGWDKPPDPNTEIIRDGSVRLPGGGGTPTPAAASPTRRLSTLERIEFDELQLRLRRGNLSPAQRVRLTELTRQALMPETPAPPAQPPMLVGEIPSPPLSLSDKDPTYWPNWLAKFFPQHFNHTCGLHVHMSFRSAMTYQKLMVEAYQATVIEYLSRWAKGKLPDDHHIWPRLRGESEYCQHKFWAGEQARQASKDYDKTRKGHRYTFIHFPHARNGTVECRGIPILELRLAEQAIQELLNITNAFLVATAEREPVFQANLEMEYEHFKETVKTII